RELSERGLTFRPHYWLSDEWFCPDGVPGIAIPFYLAHPRLARLELHQMLEVEGGAREWCLKILRHETGHAIENAYRLRQRRKRQRLFGKTSVQYPDHYTPRPYSRRFVVHLEAWYAQSHPDEDFAETFAVWLTPGSDWAQRYQGWPALRKLEYVDALMREIGPQPPPVSTRDSPDHLSKLRKTLRLHYQRKRAHYGVDKDDFHDAALRRLFSDAPPHAANAEAARFLARIRKRVRQRVRRWTHEYLYTIDQVLTDMIERCRALSLRLTLPESDTEMEFTALLTVQTMNYLHSGRHRLPL
ncbi:MAG TPA: putative zinc-binding metallopeptidase, partial [Vicinamibacteria bacterium]|nr:putative zinc-binding metallopeptidase [Vicinamibacteria bacterium]